MEPEETDPELLVGRHVVEVGTRQAWPFLTIADSVTGREVRVYVDAPFSPTREAVPVRQDDMAILAALDRVVGGTVTAARVDDGALVPEVEGEELRISGEANALTSGSPWWIGRQAAATKGQQDARSTAFFTQLRLSLQRALWGMITPSLRAVAVSSHGSVGRARFVFDTRVGDAERELVADVETEVIADFDDGETFDFTTEFSLEDRVRAAPGERWWAYRRRENDDGSA